MPYTIAEIIADGGAVGEFVEKVQAAVQALPAPVPGTFPKVAPYTDMLAGLLPDLGKLADQIRENVED
jgi:hypothetical protein